MLDFDSTSTGSLNTGYLRLTIGAFFLQESGLTPSAKFSLDVSSLLDNGPDNGPDNESASKNATMEPDIVVYRDRPVDFQNDQLQSSHMPVLAVEILSPRQGVQTLLDKSKLYFALGVQSCWLVYPHAKSIAVYHTPDDFEMFAKGELVDDKVNVRLPLKDIFS